MTVLVGGYQLFRRRGICLSPQSRKLHRTAVLELTLRPDWPTETHLPLLALRACATIHEVLKDGEECEPPGEKQAEEISSKRNYTEQSVETERVQCLGSSDWGIPAAASNVWPEGQDAEELSDGEERRDVAGPFTPAFLTYPDT